MIYPQIAKYNLPQIAKYNLPQIVFTFYPPSNPQVWFEGKIIIYEFLMLSTIYSNTSHLNGSKLPKTIWG